ncbi:Uncharacterised protein [Sphingobacterium spiritivorum]|uniref:Rieske domain-containing protein n=1 Tax=Sphingobacterium spiritivorum TaxID=258 RepID=A0A380C3T0_SPHSI|nr:hypothetical protein [Sphingobacterium spiritivorum]SUJ11561.1 Uncharacterised protein [Sphingobacterium spiritivorum]
MKALLRLGIVACITLLVYSCSKGGCNVVPSVSVHYRFSQSSNPKLFAAGGADVINGIGVAGVIVYNTGNKTFIAYDRCSTVNPEQRNKVVLDENPNIAKDPVSGAKWLLLDGSPLDIAECPLKPYYVMKQGETYIIQN